MWRHRKSGLESDPEAALRSYRPEPTEEFVQSLGRRVSAERPVPRAAWSRLAFAGAISTMIVGMFASFGGLGYAATGATSAYSVVRKAVVQHQLSVDVHQSSAAAQYSPAPEPPNNNNVAGESNTNTQGAAGVAGAGTLPFTGVSLLVTVLLGFTLLATGLILRRRERSDS